MSTIKKILVFSMPESGTAQDFALWLETRLTSPDFHQFMAELGSVRDDLFYSDDDPDPMSAPILENILGDSVAEVLEKGLSVLASEAHEEKLRALYRDSKALEMLHFRIYLDGGEYWQKMLEANAVPDASQTTSTASPQNGLLETSFTKVSQESSIRSTDTKTKAVSMSPVPAVESRGGAWFVPAAISSLCTAAIVLLLASGIPFDFKKGDSQFACKWSVKELKESKNSREFFATASEKATWPADAPTNKVELAREIARYRSVCSELMLTDFNMLATDEKGFFRTKCRAWADKFDKQLYRLEEEGDSALKDVHNEVGAIVKQLKKALMDKSKSIS